MLRQQTLPLAIVCILLAALAWLSTAPSNAGDDQAPAAKTQTGGKKIALKAFMRKKLEASQSIIEGLALEDFDLIEKGARQLKATSAAADFMVINDPLYTNHADEFRRIVAKMEKAAKEKRIDGATLGFLDMTMTCVECHKYARNILVAQ
jgi:hypothetical protein